MFSILSYFAVCLLIDNRRWLIMFVRCNLIVVKNICCCAFCKKGGL